MKAQVKTTGVALAAREGGVQGTEHAGFRDAKGHIRGEYRRLGQAVKRGVLDFIERTGADELMLVGQMYDHDARLHCFEIVAELNA